MFVKHSNCISNNTNKKLIPKFCPTFPTPSFLLVFPPQPSLSLSPPRISISAPQLLCEWRWGTSCFLWKPIRISSFGRVQLAVRAVKSIVHPLYLSLNNLRSCFCNIVWTPFPFFPSLALSHCTFPRVSSPT